MPVSLEWYLDNRIIYERVVGEISLEETGMVVGDLTEMLAKSTAPEVHVLIDLRDMASTPDNARLLSTTITPLSLQRNIGWVLIFADDIDTADFMHGAVTRLFQSRLEVVATRDAALRFLQGRDETLPQLTTEPSDNNDDDFSDEETLPSRRQ